MFTLRRQKCYSKGSPDHSKAKKVKTVCDHFNSEFTQQEGKTLDCEKRDGAITCVFCRKFDKKICLKECEVWRGGEKEVLPESRQAFEVPAPKLMD